MRAIRKLLFVAKRETLYYILECIIRLSLPLFVPRIGADYPHHAFAPDNLAIAANLFHRSQHFHGCILFS